MKSIIDRVLEEQRIAPEYKQRIERDVYEVLNTHSDCAALGINYENPTNNDIEKATMNIIKFYRETGTLPGPPHD